MPVVVLTTSSWHADITTNRACCCVVNVFVACCHDNSSREPCGRCSWHIKYLNVRKNLRRSFRSGTFDLLWVMTGWWWCIYRMCFYSTCPIMIISHKVKNFCSITSVKLFLLQRIQDDGTHGRNGFTRSYELCAFCVFNLFCQLSSAS